MKQSKTAQTKANFAAAFATLQKETKIENITVQMLSKKAGYCRSTFYGYWSSIEDFRIDILFDVAPTMTMPIDQVGEHFENLAKISQKSMQTMLVNSDESKLEVIYGKKSNPQLMEAFRKYICSNIMQMIGPQEEKVTDYCNLILTKETRGNMAITELWFQKYKDKFSFDEFTNIKTYITKYGTSKALDRAVRVKDAFVNIDL